MSARGLKIALAASVALNIFAVVGGGTAWVLAKRAEQAAEAGRQSGRNEGVWSVVESRPPEVRDQIRRELRATALEARPDFEEARATRREAIELTRSDQFDAVTVAALLERSRASEMRGRARLESGAVETLSRLSPADRAAMAAILSRHRSPRPPREGKHDGHETSGSKDAAADHKSAVAKPGQAARD
ncbi:periplasmic heavy metal sensor [Brevundimonas diminuta]|uniref:periplasmic heavy metal sensor n=1 Tax=Brevundimonas diminuta TaxID=293 RepID=UPI003D005F05